MRRVLGVERAGAGFASPPDPALQLEPCVGRVRSSRLGLERALGQRREAHPLGGLHGDGIRHPGHVDQIGPGQGLGVHLGAADDPRRPLEHGEGRLERGQHLDAGRLEAAPAQHQVAAPGQRTADRGEGPSAHDDRPAEGEALESLEVLGVSPGERAAGPDHPVGVERDDQAEWGAHTATLKRIAGWGS